MGIKISLLLSSSGLIVKTSTKPQLSVRMASRIGSHNNSEKLYGSKLFMYSRSRERSNTTRSSKEGVGVKKKDHKRSEGGHTHANGA